MQSKKDFSEDINSFFFNEQNKKKLNELKEKFDMKFAKSNEDASPEIISKFLESIEHFEEAFEKAENKKVNEILKGPTFKKLNELTSENITEEINKVLEEYERNNINVDVIEPDDVSEEDFYKFLTEELPQHEMDFVNIEGFTTNFIYEEFHPNDKLEAGDSIKYFLRGLIDNNKKDIELYLSNEKLSFNGKQLPISEFTKHITELIPGKIVDSETIFKEFEFGEQNKVSVDFIVHIEKLIDGNLKQSQNLLHLLFELQRSEFGGFEIISLNSISG